VGHPLRAVTQTLAARRRSSEIVLDQLGADAVAEYLEQRFAGSRFYFEARDVMTFLGRKLNGNFQGDLVDPRVQYRLTDRRIARSRTRSRWRPLNRCRLRFLDLAGI
jgi:hypothetical protein